ncbi:ubiquinone biosynthesis protein [Longispora fulva]|uniref:23S rRNA (Guanine745-N1)-methyltransferase n=1 Tax=Longispora fulva TaxID=619741 RepID=A0A8J7KT37_9ACTN|nr:methyltransferase domain-containing protein [Longispora fulva]MBG6140292.1 23S rRNA (guanine745-N1)-methyltransferase [Longispora fulva]GIG57328.1 ubiquinone biosynthesis protein [Longispora fulva]
MLLSALCCPVCGEAFLRETRVAERAGGVTCENGHSFDRARQGYVNLLAGKDPGTGDSAEMIAHRVAFLGAGHYEPVADLLPADPGGVIVEVGAGTGYYLGRVLDRSPRAEGLALDLSRYAARRAARAHERAMAAVADCWARLPLADDSVDLVLDVFAPRNVAEFRRVLRPGGRLAVVTPLPEHLGEIREPLGMLAVDPSKAERVSSVTDKDFELVGETELRRTMDLDHPAIAHLVGMGPSAHHTDAAGVAALPERVSVSIAVRCALYAALPR